jgi:DNA-binding MarR family transcriptional regulator
MTPASKIDPELVADAPSGGVLRNDLGWALGVVFRSYVKAANAALAGTPGGARGYQVLSAATHSEPRSQVELAQQLGIDRTVMTYLLDDLERAGLVERRPDPADRRARRVLATVVGREVLCDLERRLQGAEEHLFAGLDSEQDRQVFRALLRRLATYADALDPITDACSTLAPLAGDAAAETTGAETAGADGAPAGRR